MKLGTHKEELAQSVALADQAFWFQPDNIRWSLAEVAQASARPGLAFTQHDELIAAVVKVVRPGDQVVVMSNGGFANMPRRLVQALEAKV
jgi:UDP-N-acetylmuramate: L-alanyl-gamma-D-glutamyl-meso-diaminopimelate ligase